MKRSDFDADRTVRLVQPCFTGNGTEVLPSGEYAIDKIPDIAFALGVVTQSPAAIEPATDPSAPSQQIVTQPSPPETSHEDL